MFYGAVWRGLFVYNSISLFLLRNTNNGRKKRIVRPKRLYSLGKYRLRTPKVVDKEKAYPVELEYTWSRQIIRKTTNVFVKVTDWNQNGNQGRGEIRASYGGEFKRLNQLLLARVERIDSQLA